MKTDERRRIEEEINRTDEEIDELVYKLYEITDEENYRGELEISHPGTKIF